jgi:hypothetical protein
MDKHRPDLGHGADRDSHVLAAPHVPLLEEHVGYPVAAGFHDQPLDLPYLPVGRADGQFAADRPESSPPKLIDEYLWMRITRGVARNPSLRPTS